MAVIQGVDYSFDHPTPAELQQAGKKFACRYVYPHSQAPNTKNLTRAEATALQAHGVEVVSNFESTSGRAMAGFNAGRDDARVASLQHGECGGPKDRPIYFSVDIDTAPSDYPKLDQYLKGVASVLGVARTGVYGEYDLVKHAMDNGLVGRSSSAGFFWAWQTYAWSAGKYDERCACAQDKNNVKLGSGTVDLDSAHCPDYGQWGFKAVTKPPVKPPAKPPVKPPAKPPDKPRPKGQEVGKVGDTHLILWDTGDLTVRKAGKHLYTVPRGK